MQRPRFWFVLAVCLGGWFGAGAARAQRNVDIGTFQPALDADSFIGVQGTRTPGPERVSIGLFTDYASSLLNVDGGGGDVSVIEHRLSGVFSAEAGLGGRAALALSMPLVLYQSGE